MPVIVIIDAEEPQRIIEYFVTTHGYQSVIDGFWPSVGSAGDLHRHIKEALPANAMYHPDIEAEDCSASVVAWAKSNGFPIKKAFAFNAGNWFVSPAEPNFDEDKPPIKWEDIPRRNYKE